MKDLKREDLLQMLAKHYMDEIEGVRKSIVKSKSLTRAEKTKQIHQLVKVTGNDILVCRKFIEKLYDKGYICLVGDYKKEEE